MKKLPVISTPLQEHLIDSMIFIAKCWKNSNDFSSPTLHSDIHEEMKKFVYYDDLNSEYVQQISHYIGNILTLIQDANNHIEKTV